MNSRSNRIHPSNSPASADSRDYVFATATTLLRYSTWLLFLVLVVASCLLQPNFRDPQNLLDIVEQAVPVAIVGIGITFVLLTAGIDLAVGATMYMAVVISASMVDGLSVPAMFAVGIGVGAGMGLVHALIVNIFQVPPFIVTLSTMFVFRGIGKQLTQTKAIIATDAITRLERASLLGIPLAIWGLLITVMAAWLILNRTAIGRQIYAVGESFETAEKAGINVGQIILFVYVICGAFAGLAGMIAMSQQGAAQNTFGSGMEFAAVAAAVLGGTSLYGGQGNAWGAVFGAVFVAVVNASLNFANVDPYLYPLVTASLIFAAATLDSLRQRVIAKQSRRRIRV